MLAMKSKTGSQLARALILSYDSKGKRIPPLPTGYEGIKCKESPPHALSNPDDGQTEAQAERAGRVARAEAELTDLERAVLRFQGKLESREEVRIRIAAGDLSEYLRDDYTLVPGSEELHQRAGLPPISTVEVVGHEIIQVEQTNYEEMAEHLGVEVWRVKKAVASAHRKLRAAR